MVEREPAGAATPLSALEQPETEIPQWPGLGLAVMVAFVSGWGSLSPYPGSVGKFCRKVVWNNHKKYSP